MNKNSVYVLHENVRILDNGKDEIRLRRGIWNYEEAEIELATFSVSAKEFFRNMIGSLCEDSGFQASIIDDSSLTNNEKEIIKSLLTQLETGNYILDLLQRDLNRELSYALLGYGIVGDKTPFGKQNEPEILVFTDSEYAKKTIQDLSSVMNLKITFSTQEDYDLLCNSDLTTKIDALATQDMLAKLKKRYGECKVYLVCYRNMSTKFVHNLNRLSLECSVPMVVSFIDGPMISILSIKPYDTGCYECFENRLLARIQDHVLFHQFEQNARSHKMDCVPCLTPIMNFLANISLVECYLFAYYGASRFEGRLLSIFIPTLEIQVQDVLRVPFCNACGMVAREQLKEKNISTRALIDNFVDAVITKEISR